MRLQRDSPSPPASIGHRTWEPREIQNAGFSCAGPLRSIPTRGSLHIRRDFGAFANLSRLCGRNQTSRHGLGRFRLTRVAMVIKTSTNHSQILPSSSPKNSSTRDHCPMRLERKSSGLVVDYVDKAVEDGKWRRISLQRWSVTQYRLLTPQVVTLSSHGTRTRLLGACLSSQLNPRMRHVEHPLREPIS
jgi:hypothetical protein